MNRPEAPPQGVLAILCPSVLACQLLTVQAVSLFPLIVFFCKWCRDKSFTCQAAPPVSVILFLLTGELFCWRGQQCCPHWPLLRPRPGGHHPRQGLREAVLSTLCKIHLFFMDGFNVTRSRRALGAGT
jgi:hypothetical protein